MIKRLLIILMMTLLTAACTRKASTIPTTEAVLNFPTPALSELPLCQTTDLQTSSNSTGATGAITLGVTLTNKSKQPCTLSNPPQLTILNGRFEPIPVQIIEQNPIQTKPAAELVQLAPEEGAIITLIWRNYCKPIPDDSLVLRLSLPQEQNLDIAIKIQAEPRCDAEKEPSTITVAPYSYPP